MHGRATVTLNAMERSLVATAAFLPQLRWGICGKTCRGRGSRAGHLQTPLCHPLLMEFIIQSEDLVSH